MLKMLTHRRGSRLRWPLAAAALIAAAAHLPVIGPHLREAPYMGVLFVVLSAACTVLAAAAVLCDSAAVYGLSILTCGLAVAGYTATRLIEFPMLADDVGNWAEPLGLISIAAEGIVIALAVTALLRCPAGARIAVQRRLASAES